jgi:hypothetical protein
MKTCFWTLYTLSFYGVGEFMYEDDPSEPLQVYTFLRNSRNEAMQ